MFEAFSKYADFSGRASRSEYWLFQLFNLIVLAVVCGLVIVGIGGEPADDFEHAASSSGAFLAGVALFVFWLLISVVPNFAVAVRRFHDHNVSGWWYIGLLVFSMIPYIGLLGNIGILWVCVRGGTWGPNDYGPDPVNPWRNNPTFA